MGLGSLLFDECSIRFHLAWRHTGLVHLVNLIVCPSLDLRGSASYFEKRFSPLVHKSS